MERVKNPKQIKMKFLIQLGSVLWFYKAQTTLAGLGHMTDC